MLHIFRKYQRYIFLLVTIVIIISFSFFGTYSTLDSNPNIWREQIAFKAVNGHEVTRLDLEDMAHFLATDNDDKILYGGAWGPNFLNDGVIRKDFLETGLGTELAVAYTGELKEDFDKRFAKEKTFKLYTNPNAHFLGVEHVWSYFAPQMTDNYRNLRTAVDPLDPDAFRNRVELFLAEKKIPAPTLKYILKYQEKQYSWLKPDLGLDQMDLSLFGHHTVEDWFGPQFTRLVSEFIINAAILAEAQGYDVSRAETMADLIRNTQTSYQQNLDNPSLGVASPEQYLNEQLRRMNMDLGRAVKVWRQVLLFRRYFQDAGAIALVDPLVSQKLNHYAYETVNVDLYQLPPELRMANFETLQNLETYLYAVSKQDKKDPLFLPQNFLPVEKVAAKYPELVQKRYLLEVAETDNKTLKAKIGLRELWGWEMEDQNWELLKKEFPVLAVKKGDTRDERFEILDNLDPATRSKVDAFAKESMIKAHPEWIHQALDNAVPKKIVAGIRTQGGQLPIVGLDDKEKRENFIQLLDNASLGTAPSDDSPLYVFNSDEGHFYRITVLERENQPEILTFAEAQKDGTMDLLRQRLLEKYYLANRSKTPELYRLTIGEWKPFAEVREQVAAQYLEKHILALNAVQESLSPSEQKVSSNDQLAALRFYPYLKSIRDEVESDPSNEKKWIKQPEDRSTTTLLTPRSPFSDQWKIEKGAKTLNRQSREESVDLSEALVAAPGTLSTVKVPPNGDLAFYAVKEEGEDSGSGVLIAEQVKQVQTLLGNEGQRHLMGHVLKELKAKGALSLAYLKTPSDGEGEMHPETID